MARRDLDRYLKGLNQKVMEMGELVKDQIARSVDALKRRDLAASQKVIEDDALVNRKRFDIEEECLHIIATQQPVAGDLRTIVAVLNVIVDMERMGDHAEGIGKISLMIGNTPLIKPLIDVPRMAEIASDMLTRALHSFLTHNVEEARQVCRDDDQVDGLYDQIYRELLSYMLSDPRTINGATHLLWVSHNLERIGDRATNIAERTIYLATGKMVEMASKY